MTPSPPEPPKPESPDRDVLHERQNEADPDYDPDRELGAGREPS
jgi:hypothetical protein